MMGERLTANLFQVLIDSNLIKLISFTLFNRNGVEWTVAKAGAQAVAKVVGEQLGFTVYNLNCTLGTRGYALAATVALFLINFDHFTKHRFISCLEVLLVSKFR